MASEESSSARSRRRVSEAGSEEVFWRHSSRARTEYPWARIAAPGGQAPGPRSLRERRGGRR